MEQAEHKFSPGDTVIETWEPLTQWIIISYKVPEQMTDKNAIDILKKEQKHSFFRISNTMVLCKRWDDKNKTWIGKEIPEDKLELINS